MVKDPTRILKLIINRHKKKTRRKMKNNQHGK